MHHIHPDEQMTYEPIRDSTL